MVQASAAVTELSVGCRINDPTGCLWITRRFENKHEDEGGVNWKLPRQVLVIKEWDSLREGIAVGESENGLGLFLQFMRVSNDTFSP